jgi:hypothetical protein
MPPKTKRKTKKQLEEEKEHAAIGNGIDSQSTEVVVTQHVTSSDEMQQHHIRSTTVNGHCPGTLGNASTLEEPIVLQLPILPGRIDELIYGEDINSILTYNPQLTEPEPYFPDNQFVSENDNIAASKNAGQDIHLGKTKGMYQNVTCEQQHHDVNQQTTQHHDIKCFWCCHNIVDTEYGMPIRYDAFHQSFSIFGSYCSLECAAAYNYSVNMGSNRVWEIHSWIQLLGKRYGMQCPIRPAPSKYLLKMFNGPLDITEFRNVHKGMSQTCTLNIPPFLRVNSHMELINTSFLEKDNEKEKDKEREKEREREKDRDEPQQDLKEIRVLKGHVGNNTLEKKMNLSFT